MQYHRGLDHRGWGLLGGIAHASGPALGLPHCRARLQGRCGLPTKTPGSVVFVIQGDGRKVFRSQQLVLGMTERYDDELRGVDELTLLTEDGGDGEATR